MPEQFILFRLPSMQSRRHLLIYIANGRVQAHFKPLQFLFLLFQTEYYQCLAAHHDRIEHNCACRVIRVLHLDGWLDQVGEGEGGEAGKGSG